MVEDIQNLTTQYIKASRRGFKIISYMFNLNVKLRVSLSNLLYPYYGVNLHNYLKRQKMPKRIKMLTSIWHQKEENLLTHHFRSLKCIRFVKNNFFVTNNGEGGGNFTLCPLLGLQGILTGPNWHLAQLDHVFYKIRP